MPVRWLEERDESWGRRLVLAPLLPVSWAYRAAAACNRRLQTRVGRQRRLSCPVVSVGNLVVGGTGKTPLAAWLAVELRRRGHKVVLASRGYGRSGREAVEVVSDGRHVLASVESAGDEPMWLAAAAPGVPVLVGRDRGLVGLRALAAFDADVLLLDDGFQHHRLQRDVDIVCFDGRLGFGNRKVLPRGPLREGLPALARADAIAVTGGPLREPDEALIAKWAPSAQRLAAERRPARLRDLASGEQRAIESLSGAEVGLLAGLAQPRSFVRTVEALGARVVAERFFPDHHRYRAEDLRSLAAQAPRWLTTEKDAVKLVPHWAGGVRVEVLGIALQVEEPKRFLDWIEKRLR